MCFQEIVCFSDFILCVLLITMYLFSLFLLLINKLSSTSEQTIVNQASSASQLQAGNYTRERKKQPFENLNSNSFASIAAAHPLSNPVSSVKNNSKTQLEIEFGLKILQPKSSSDVAGLSSSSSSSSSSTVSSSQLSSPTSTPNSLAVPSSNKPADTMDASVELNVTPAQALGSNDPQRRNKKRKPPNYYQSAEYAAIIKHADEQQQQQQLQHTSQNSNTNQINESSDNLNNVSGSSNASALMSSPAHANLVHAAPAATLSSVNEAGVKVNESSSTSHIGTFY
jgi:hypothetical protein